MREEPRVQKPPHLIADIIAGIRNTTPASHGYRINLSTSPPGSPSGGSTPNLPPATSPEPQRGPSHIKLLQEPIPSTPRVILNAAAIIVLETVLLHTNIYVAKGDPLTLVVLVEQL
ncbi:hypothetical protein [Pyrolobus fumarii]|uniref:hypothetical protein n=1 Tax=Pyrolobus fumarii TaxID=54252 RepID=UPI001432AD94|nr:hypothetical protein [Pyrolobus fumarii]